MMLFFAITSSVWILNSVSSWVREPGHGLLTTIADT